ncbi:acetyl xylan esterase [Diaporthe helianthi]|uniref:Carboxylic ester hydrolase n=1 Tax=Diaporthe helianthi TaxID=158607 RepID=A0A2P5HKT2_DIAHE|nr:acetyl xylan esterase [Diaporthe helianthi]
MMLLKAIIAGLLAAPTALAAQLTKVNYPNDASSKADMYIYVPDKVVANPPLVVVIHSCQSSAQAYFQNSLIPWHRGSDTCWDVSSKASLMHGGGGDTQAISNMIKYAISQYKVDASRVFVTGGSSGAMMSNVLAATYPEQIQALSLYSGVPAGCFLSSSGGVDQWNSSCASGQVSASADAWGNVARNMYPGYDGTRPRMQIWHGSADSTLSPQNYNEEIKQWTNVFGIGQTPTSSTKNRPQSNYQTDDYGPNVQGIYATGVGHSVPSNLTASEEWFGL